MKNNMNTCQSTFEQNKYQEIEQRYIPLVPEQLAQFREQAYPIEQLYLSQPTEPFSLRLRESCRNGEPAYTAALKDRGTITDQGLDRLEIETSISEATYNYYKQFNPPLLRKLRAEPLEAIVVDFFEDGSSHIESEAPAAWMAFSGRHPELQCAIDTAASSQHSNEQRAYASADSPELSFTPAELEPQTVVQDILRHLNNHKVAIVQIGGRSGSGKSTLTRQITELLTMHDTSCITLSTDDYHRGKTWLDRHKGGPWTDWDAPIVYHTEELARDLQRLQHGESIQRRYFNFASQEPEQREAIQPAPIVLIEGIYAHSPDLTSHAHLSYEVPTPLATCIGRRLLRDFSTNRANSSLSRPEDTLRYLLENAEPAYRAQHGG